MLIININIPGKTEKWGFFLLIFLLKCLWRLTCSVTTATAVGLF